MQAIFETSVFDKEAIRAIFNSIKEISWYGSDVCYDPGHRWLQFYSVGRPRDIIFIDDEYDMELFIHWLSGGLIY